MPDPRKYHFKLPLGERPSEIILQDPWYPGVESFWSNCTTKRTGHPIMDIVAVVVHATAGSSSEGAVSVMKLPPKKAASFHWLVPDEDEPQHAHLVWACVPESLAAWHVRNAASHADVNAGATRVNHWSLGIEVVNLQKTSDAFSDWQLEATARIVRYCWAKYPNLVDVVSHAKLDPTRRSDPGVNFNWDRFKDLVLDSPAESVPQLVAQAKPLGQIPSDPAASRCCHVDAAAEA
jgi:N-acetylmuramoyl-L-alanine amidase